MDVMGEPVEQRTGEPLGTEHAGPFVERQVYLPSYSPDFNPIALFVRVPLQPRSESGGSP
jgi:hypothetical protein